MRPFHYLLLLLALMLSALLLAVCSDVDRHPVPPAGASANAEMIRKITYHKDERPRPALCFAYMWDGMGSGGCGLSEVSCGTVGHLATPLTKYQNIVYYRDSRPESAVCYAYMWCGARNGGPGLANVPCVAVRHLLPREPIDYD